MSIEVSLVLESVRKVEKQLGELAHRAPGALSASLNRTVSSVQTELSSGKGLLVPKYHIKPTEVRGTMKLKEANRSSLQATLTSTGKIRPIEKFKVKPFTVQPKRKSQLSMAVKKGNIKKVTSVFVADLHGAKVFRRSSKKRLPIERLFGPSVPQMIKNEEVSSGVERKALNVFNNRIKHEVDRILDKL